MQVQVPEEEYKLHYLYLLTSRIVVVQLAGRNNFQYVDASVEKIMPLLSRGLKK